MSRSLAFLDWPEVVARLAAHARSTLGAEACRSLAFSATPAEAMERMRLSGELGAILEAEGKLPDLTFPDVEPHLAAVEQGATLGPAELGEIAALCEVSAAARRFFDVRATLSGGGLPPAPGVWAVGEALEAREDIARWTRDIFDASGQIKDSFSPELAALRRERDGLVARLRQEMERLMDSEELAPLVQDRYVTQRGDRFVLPLKASFKSMGLGIVHDTSRTGETVFLEPSAVIELNNRLKVAELGIGRESRRILEEISAAIARSAPSLRADTAILVRIDVLAAQARLAIATAAGPVEIVEQPLVDLRQARHPLLVLRAAAERFAVVANDVVLGVPPGAELGPGAAADRRAARVLVVSGPNAGGKTVLLKTVGLAALLARAGMHVPAARGSRIGFFDPVLAEIGDQQSVAGDLSTFSGHAAGVAGVLRSASAEGARPLVLVDELMAGTNPDQGAALARATLEAMVDLPGLVLVTTHYDALKALAETDPRFRNAGMEYDAERLRPTFRLRDGTPGRSYAFDIAGRMGLPPSVLDRARELAGAGALGLEAVVSTLEAREAALARETEALEHARAELAAASGDRRAAAEALARREKDLARHAREAIDSTIREAREGIRAIVRQAQELGTPRAAESAQRALAEAARAATHDLPAPSALDVEGLRAALADRALGVKGGQTRVSVGAARVAAVPAQRPGARSDDGGELPGVQTAANTVDLRGMRADDSLEAVTSFLDRAALDGISTVFVIHGHGTGALKKVVREYLATSPYVSRWRPGGRGQGGDGVSVVELG